MYCIVQVLDLSRLGWPARLYIEYTVTFSYKVMRRLRKTYKEFLQ